TTMQVGSAASMLVSDFGGQVMDADVACLQGSGAAVSVATAWRPLPGIHSTRVREVNNNIAYVFDWLRNHSLTMQSAFSYTTTSALFVNGGCATGLARARDFVMNDTEITINGSPRRPGQADGIYGGADDRANVGGFQ